METTGKFKDKRDREWEWFIDVWYYDCTCVRPTNERDFNSELSFHFNTYEKAMQFVELLKEAS